MKEELDFFTQNMEDPIIIHGGAKGIDRFAAQWAEWNWYIQKVFYPDYEKYDGKVAPLKRNEEMAQIADYAICFWNCKSKGTEHMINEMRKLGKHVEIIEVMEKS